MWLLLLATVPFAQACTLIDGDGVGGTEAYQGSMTADQCLSQCQGVSGANGMTVSNGCVFGGGACSCYCELGMTGSNGSGSYSTCLFSSPTSGSCTLQQGDGTGGTEAYQGSMTAEQCLSTCQADSSANGMTVSNDCLFGGGNCTCYCEYGMNGDNDSGSWDSCQFRAAGSLTSAPTPVTSPCDAAASDASCCNSNRLCTTGEGDCDNDSDCEGSLVCRQNAGAETGFGASWDICGVYVCDAVRNDANCCSSSNPCTTGEGDCDSDSECEGDLVCRHNVGAEFGFASDWDICGVRTPCDSAANDANCCSSNKLCYAGEGDCDSDSDCMAGLVCRHDVGAESGFGSDWDLCGEHRCDAALNDANCCSSSRLCDVGEGDCDSDSDCMAGLVCRYDVGAESGFGSTWDICGAPAATDAPTEPAATDAPTEPAATDAPTEPAATDAPTEPAATDAPTEPAATDSPTEPASTDAPTEPAATDAPTEPAATDAPTDTEVSACAAGENKGDCKAIATHACQWAKIKRGQCSGGFCHTESTPKKVQVCVPVVCSEFNKQKKCKKQASTCNWANNMCNEGATVPSCADNTKSGKCNKAGGCVWMNNECVEGTPAPPACADNTKKNKCGQPSKNGLNCWWFNNECHDAPQ